MKYILDTNIVIPKNRIVQSLKNNHKLSLPKIVKESFQTGATFITPFVYSELYAQFWKGYSNYINKHNDNDIAFLTEKEEEKAKKRIEILSEHFLKQIKTYVLPIQKDTFSEIVKTRPHIISDQIPLKKLKDQAIAIEFSSISGDITFVTNNQKDFKELKSKYNVIKEEQWINKEQTSHINNNYTFAKPELTFHDSSAVENFIFEHVNNSFEEWEMNVLENMLENLEIETDGKEFIISYDGINDAMIEIHVSRKQLSPDDAEAVDSLIYNIIDERKDFIKIEKERYGK